jgi:hypothetical protein
MIRLSRPSVKKLKEKEIEGVKYNFEGIGQIFAL